MQLAQLKATTKGLFLAFGVAGLVSCGSGDEAGGGGSCGGADESGICLQASLIQPFHLDDVFTGAIDVNLVPDCDLIAPGLQPEPYTEHLADITFNASLVSGNPVAASFVQLTNMTVTFTQNNPGVPAVTCTVGGIEPSFPASCTPALCPCNAIAGAGPAISQLTTPIDVTIPVGSSVTQTLMLIDLERKNLYTPAFGDDIFTDGPFDPTPTTNTIAPFLPPLLFLDVAFLSYNVRYVFSGEDEFGNSVDATAATEVRIGAFGNCP